MTPTPPDASAAIRTDVAHPRRHLAFGADPATLWLIADRLAQAEAGAVPFTPPPRLRFLYPAG